MNHDLKLMAAQAAVDKMFAGTYFEICTIDKIADMLGMKCRGSDAYSILRTLHCVHFNEMPAELAAQVPELMAKVFDGGINIRYQFHAQYGAYGNVIETDGTAKPAPKKGLLRMFGKGGAA